VSHCLTLTPPLPAPSLLCCSYIDPHLASPYGPDGQRACESAEGLRAHTHRSIDKFSTGLAVMEFLFGRLPAPVDLDKYRRDEWPQYLAAVHEFDWASCEEMLALPTEARDLLCSMLARYPEQRPQSTFEVLRNDPWLTGKKSREPSAVALVTEAGEEAAAAWDAAHDELDSILGCGDEVMQRLLAIATAPQAAAVSSSCSPADCTATTSSNDSDTSNDASCCRMRSSTTSSSSIEALLQVAAATATPALMPAAAAAATSMSCQ
jgi:serine/threonine protein kinase